MPKTKAQLTKELNLLKKTNEQYHTILVDHSLIEVEPNLSQVIVDTEKEALEQIALIIHEAEEITGRNLPFPQRARVIIDGHHNLREIIGILVNAVKGNSTQYSELQDANQFAVWVSTTIHKMF